MSQPQGKPTTPFKNRNFIVLLIMILLLFVMFPLATNETDEEMTRTEFLAMMGDSTKIITELSLQKTPDGVIVEGTRQMSPEEIAEAKQQQSPIARITKAGSEPNGKKRFKTHMLDVTNEMASAWEAYKGVKVKVVHESTTWIDTIMAFLPVVLLIAFFWIMTNRQMGGGGKNPFSFGKSQVKQLNNNKKKTMFSDVAGCDEAKQDLQELVEFLKCPKKYDELGGRIPKGALLVGPPGTGKTLLARAVAGEAGVPFFSMSGSDFVEMFVGVGASRVRDLFETGKKNAPCILFIDEIDAVGRQRGAGLGGGHDEREQTLNQLLVEMDGFAANEGVILIAATNRPDVLDKALLRPGRFDRQIVVGLPDLKGREEILKVHLKKRKVPLDKDVDVSAIAKGTPGLAGADLENLVNEAALLAARFNNKKVTMLDFEEARDKLSMGAERRTLLMTDEEKRHTAYHEAGHAVVMRSLPDSDPVHQVTIMPRGRAGGFTMSLPEEDRYYATKKEMLNDISDRDQKLFKVIMTVMISADSLAELDELTEAVSSTARKHMCQFGVLKYQQIEGFNATLPLGINKLLARRTLTTESLAVFMPFKVQEIQHRDGIFQGTNVISKNMIFVNRKELLNGNAFILGVPGSGKSFTAKEEIVNLLLTRDADIIIIDPEREYKPLVNALNGQVIELSAGSSNHINCLDINAEYADGTNPIILKSDFILSLFEQIAGRENIYSGQKSIIDRCLSEIYTEYIRNNYRGDVPTLVDLADSLKRQPEPEAKELATMVELFATGSQSAFAHQTNVDINNRLVCFDILDLGTQLMPIGMLVVLDSILNRITRNRAAGRETYIFIDEIYLMFKHEYSADFLFTLWKRVRKYGAYCTGITQNVDDLLQSHTARTMLANSEFIVMLNQGGTDREDLANLLQISDDQMKHITNVDAGHGLIKVGSDLVPFERKFPRNTELYKLMTTKISEC